MIKIFKDNEKNYRYYISNTFFDVDLLLQGK